MLLWQNNIIATTHHVHTIVRLVVLVPTLGGGGKWGRNGASGDDSTSGGSTAQPGRDTGQEKPRQGCPARPVGRRTSQPPTQSPGILQEQWLGLDKPKPGTAHGRCRHKLPGIEPGQAGHLLRMATALCRRSLGSQGRSQRLQALAEGLADIRSIQVPPAMASQHCRASPLRMERGP